ncbi:MAG: diadenylate cyclase CdaA [Armatimonadetes bacterium]|nr:diadenylate cyclase CdaA [Armatimonadota bacterium]MDW8153322.1 diadenylate cyclase CdaA [Armatimonadota bacterium]
MSWPLPLRITDLVDIAIVSFVVYQVMVLIRGTRAVQLVQGIAVLAAGYLLASFLQLYTLQAILGYLGGIIPVALLVLFQPELRRLLEQIGRGRLLWSAAAPLERDVALRLANDLARAARILGQRRIGALMVIERRTGLNDFIETGIRLDALVSVPLLLNIFYPNTPLHDGAVIVRGNRVVAAGCLLPLSESPLLSRALGTRHRAAVGITEGTDAVAIVVSEETGTVSLAQEGSLRRGLSEEELKATLLNLFVVAAPRHPVPWWRSRPA